MNKPSFESVSHFLHVLSTSFCTAVYKQVLAEMIRTVES